LEYIKVIEDYNIQRFNTRIEGAYLIRPKVFGDSRGHFFESWNKKIFQHIGINVEFVQDNCSKSSRYVLSTLKAELSLGKS